MSGEAIAICALSSIEYGVVFLGALRAGVAVAPLAPSSSAESLVTMLADCGAKLLFLDATVAKALAGAQLPRGLRCISLDGGLEQAFDAWLAPIDAHPAPVVVDPAAPFNIIYSSGHDRDAEGHRAIASYAVGSRATRGRFGL